MAGRPPSKRQTPAQADKAAQERARYQALTRIQKRAIVKTRDRDAQQAADNRRHQRHKEERNARHQEINARPEHAPARAARAQVQAAKDSGRLRVPATCTNCGARGRLEAHHPDHGKPLDVKFLCPKCHGKTYRLTK